MSIERNLREMLNVLENAILELKIHDPLKKWEVDKLMFPGEEHATIFIKQGASAICKMNGPCLLTPFPEHNARIIVEAVNVWRQMFYGPAY